jgi:hypothetical protein
MKAKHFRYWIRRGGTKDGMGNDVLPRDFLAIVFRGNLQFARVLADDGYSVSKHRTGVHVIVGKILEQYNWDNNRHHYWLYHRELVSLQNIVKIRMEDMLRGEYSFLVNARDL